MRRKNSLYGIAILVLLLVLGVGYAVVSSVDLSINGTAGTLTTNSDLKVVFTDKILGENTDMFLDSLSFGETTASFSVKNLSRKGDETFFGFIITNNESDIIATIDNITISNDNSEYFNVMTGFAESLDAEGPFTTPFELAPGQSVYMVVGVILDKTPTTVQNANITINFEANPVAQ